MNHNDDTAIEALLPAWQIDTIDITGRVSSAIGGQTAILEAVESLLCEVQALRSELDAVRQSNRRLQEEVAHLRADLASRRVVRLAPFAPADCLVRLS